LRRTYRRSALQLRSPDGGVHVLGDFGGGEGAVVDADFVDATWEELAAVGVAADAEGGGVDLEDAGTCLGGDLGAVDVDGSTG
jgi:hypothetical protein